MLCEYGCRQLANWRFTLERWQVSTGKGGGFKTRKLEQLRFQLDYANTQPNNKPNLFLI